MKHLLPLLAIAFLGTAATASAENFYYDYYRDANVSPMSYTKLGEGLYDPDYYSDSTKYKDFEVVRNSNWNVDETNPSVNVGQSNFYRIHVMGKAGTQVSLFLTDFVDNAGSDNNASALYRNIDAYGYRKLTEVDAVVHGTKVKQYVAAGDTVIRNLTGDDAIKPAVKDSVDITKENYNDPGSALEDGGSYTVTRYQYYLGTFTSGDVIELYMQDQYNEDGVYSYSGFNATDVNGEPGVVGALGGFGDGGYRISEQTDEMLNGYYFQDVPLEEAGYGALKFGDDKDARAEASAKAMPLSTLNPSTTTGGLYFGIIATTASVIIDDDGNVIIGNGAAGSPLPGGLQMALIAGLFGLGFWYIRHRKAAAA